MKDFVRVVAMEAADDFRFGLGTQDIDVRPRRQSEFCASNLIQILLVHYGHPLVPILARATRKNAQFAAGGIRSFDEVRDKRTFSFSKGAAIEQIVNP